MKKSILLALLLAGVAGGTSQARDAFAMNAHQDLHDQIGDQHEALHLDLDRQHKALHYQLDRERASGVPRWQVQAQHEAWHRWARAQHDATHDGLRREHMAGHWNVRRF